MKNILIILSSLLFSNILFSQNIIEREFENFADLEETTSIYVSGKMFNLAAQIDIESDDKDVEELQDFVGTIKSFNLIMVPELANPVAEYKNGLTKVANEYDELLRMREKDNRFSVYINETDGTVHEIVGIGTTEDKFMVFSLLGNMDLKQVGKFASKIQADGFKELSKIQETGAASMKVYPNPISVDGTVTVDVPEPMKGAAINVYDMNGNRVKKATASSAKEEITMDGLVTGTYIVELSKGEITMKKKVIVVR